MKNCKLPTVTAHSGCEGTADNSVDSIRKAAEVNADIIEIDIRFAKDGTPVLSHDTPKGSEVTLDTAFSVIAEYPSLRVNLDIKETTYLENIPPLAEKYSLTDRIFYTGIFERDVPAVKEKTPEVKYYLNYGLPPAFLQITPFNAHLCKKIKMLGAAGLNVSYRNVSLSLSRAVRRAGLEFSLWTVNKTEDMPRVLRLKPDNITSRIPSQIIKFIKDKE